MESVQNVSETVTLLLVEDDDVDTMAIRRAFKTFKVANTLIRARDGLEALELLRGQSGQQVHRPSIILLDLNMPRMNGIEFLAELRADERLRDNTVFVITTSDSHKDRVAAYRQNIAGYIRKKDVGQGFERLINLLNSYWNLVLLP